jgi:hypothetical protein
MKMIKKNMNTKEVVNVLNTTKRVPKQKNIIQPNFNLIKDSIIQSLEELNVGFGAKNYDEQFSVIKESKLKYRFSLFDAKIKQCSFSKNYYRSKVKWYNF